MAATDIPSWLHSLGLAQYEAAFREHDIDPEVLPELTEGDLERLGISLGHRKRLLKAIRALQTEAPASVPTTPPVRPLAPNAQPLAERRQLTVMFCDLVGSTELASRLDAEDLREVITRYQARVTETVTRFDGFVAKYMGDGVLAYFGYPNAHEDDAEQAVRAGLTLVNAVGELQAPPRLQVRLGIATGLVVVGDLIGAGSAQEQAVVGETPNLAARLQALAEPNSIVIADSTRRQTGAMFKVRDLGVHSLKGFAEPQLAWCVLSENRVLGRFEALRSGATPLVGRDEELELLLRRWAQAKAGSGRVVLISGEPGVGKSRVVETLVERIASEPHIRLRYFCSPHRQDSALHPVIAQQERAAGFDNADSPTEKLSKLQAVLAAAAPPIEDIALIAELHSLPATDLAPTLDLSPQRKKEKTFEALLGQAAGLSQQQPLVMIFEDIHWIDPSSRELLDRAIERAPNWCVLLLATFRPEFQPPWVGQPHLTMLTLARLDRHDTTVMVEKIADHNTLPGDIVEEIAERTDGVPLFVEELTRAVLEAGAQAVLSSVPHPSLSVPATLHASLMARLDRLGPAAKIVAQTGATIGREFGYELLVLVADLPEPQIFEALDRLANSGLLLVRGRPPQSSYFFKHALVQDAAYGTLLRSRRHDLHRKVAEALEARFSETVAVHPELLAHHFTEAGRYERGIEYWLKAGQQAVVRSAMTEAEALLRKGIALILNLPDNLWRREYELDLQIALGQALIAKLGYGKPAVRDVFSRARQLCECLGRRHKLLPILYGQWAYYLSAGELDRAHQLATESRQLGHTQGDVITRVVGYHTSGVTDFFVGNFAAARKYLEQGLMLCDPSLRSLYAEITPTDPYTNLSAYLSLTLACSGHLGKSASMRDTALSGARALSHSHALALALNRSWLAAWCGRSPPERLLDYADELLKVSGERGFLYWRALGLVSRGWSLTALGHADTGIPLMTSGLADLSAVGTATVIPSALTTLADAYRMAGQAQVALTHLAEAEQLAERSQLRWVLAETVRLRGDLLLLTGGGNAAEGSFHDAITLARRQNAKLFELRAATSLARIWRDQGKVEDAQALLAPIYAWFTEGFDAPDLIEAKALLSELAEQTRREAFGGAAARG